MATVSIKHGTSKGSEWTTPASDLYAGRTVFLTGAIEDLAAEGIITQLLCLERMGTDPITLVLNSPGGSVSAGLAIVDCMNAIASPVRTFGTGMVASMAATILACGERGARSVSPNADVLIHQPLMGGMGGQASDIAIAAESIVKKKQQLNQMLAKACGKTEKQVEKATDRDNRMTAEQAVAFGIADYVDNAFGRSGNDD